MENQMKTWVGIDVSKLTLDVCWYVQEEPVFLKVSNDVKGFESLLSKLPAAPHVVMEATGAYYLRLANFLLENSIPQSVVNPLTIKRFTQMRLTRVKTDKYDASIIAKYGTSEQPKPWSIPDIQIMEMQQLCALEDSLVVQKGMMINQKEAFTQNPFASKTALKAIEGAIRHLEKALKKIGERLNEITREHYPRITEILCSIPGMGIKTAQALIVVTRGFREHVNGRALCSFVGLAPCPYQSGTSLKGRGAISKMGNPNVRKKIYMCSISAIGSNPACKEFYERLKAKGKPGKVALVAVACKLLRQAAAMVRADELFDEKLAMGG
jgi:transposase